jgi:hypothetical protein
MRTSLTLPIAIALSLTAVFAKGPSAWKSEKDFRNAAPMVHRQALWLEAHPDADGWSDTLQTVLSWGRDVPYVKLGTAKVFEKEIQNLPKDAAAGRVGSMMMVGYTQYATEEGFDKPTEFDMAKAGVTAMIRYYGNLRQAKPDYAIPQMERLSGLLQSDALDEYIQAKLRK